MLAVPGSPPVPLSAAGGQGQGQSDDWERAAPVARPPETSSKATILTILMTSAPGVQSSEAEPRRLSRPNRGAKVKRAAAAIRAGRAPARAPGRGPGRWLPPRLAPPRRGAPRRPQAD